MPTDDMDGEEEQEAGHEVDTAAMAMHWVNQWGEEVRQVPGNLATAQTTSSLSMTAGHTVPS